MLPLRHTLQCFFWQFGQVGTSLDMLLSWRPVSPCGVDEFSLEDPKLFRFKTYPMLRFPPDLFLLLSRYWVISFNALLSIIACYFGTLALLLRVSRTPWTSPSRILYIQSIRPSGSIVTLRLPLLAGITHYKHIKHLDVYHNNIYIILLQIIYPIAYRTYSNLILWCQPISLIGMTWSYGVNLLLW